VRIRAVLPLALLLIAVGCSSPTATTPTATPTTTALTSAERATSLLLGNAAEVRDRYVRIAHEDADCTWSIEYAGWPAAEVPPSTAQWSARWSMDVDIIANNRGIRRSGFNAALRPPIDVIQSERIVALNQDYYTTTDLWVNPFKTGDAESWFGRSLRSLGRRAITT